MSWIATGVRVSGSMPRASARSRARSEAYCSMSAVTRARAPDTHGPHEGLLEARGAGARPDRRRAAVGAHGAVSDDQRHVAERADLLHYVAREQHAVPVIAERCGQTPERQLRDGVEPVGRLVQHEV